MERLAAKCHWEHMSRLAVLAEYEDIICKDCRNKMDIQEIQHFKKGQDYEMSRNNAIRNQ